MFWNQVPQFESRLPTKYGAKLRSPSNRHVGVLTGAGGASARSPGSNMSPV